MRTVLSMKMPYGLLLEQRANGTFKVTYGKEVKDNLEYAEAAKEFGLCLFHALACEGKLDNGEKNEI